MGKSLAAPQSLSRYVRATIYTDRPNPPLKVRFTPRPYRFKATTTYRDAQGE